jgi:hypothetical protein
MEHALLPAAQEGGGMGIPVTAEKQHLEKDHAGRPDRRAPSEPGEDVTPDQGLYLKEKE